MHEFVYCELYLQKFPGATVKTKEDEGRQQKLSYDNTKGVSIVDVRILRIIFKAPSGVQYVKITLKPLEKDVDKVDNIKIVTDDETTTIDDKLLLNGANNLLDVKNLLNKAQNVETLKIVVKFTKQVILLLYYSVDLYFNQ